MKQFKLTLISLAAIAFARPQGMCTANGVGEDLEKFKAEVAESQAASDAKIAELEAANADLQTQLAAKAALPEPPADNSTLVLLCRGAGVDIADVRWRVQAGLDPEMAVAAAIAQKEHNEKSNAKK